MPFTAGVVDSLVVEFGPLDSIVAQENGYYLNWVRMEKRK